MAKNYLGQMEQDARRLRLALRDEDALPGWVSAYIFTSADRLQTASRYMDQRIQAFQPSEYSGKMFDDLELLPNTPKVFLGFGTAGALAGATVGFVVGALLPGTSKKVCVLAGALMGAGAGLYFVQSDDPHRE